MVAQNMLRTYGVKYVFSEKEIGYDSSFDVTKCLEQIEMSDLLHMCAKGYEQPSNIKTLGTYGFTSEKSSCPLWLKGKFSSYKLS